MSWSDSRANAIEIDQLRQLNEARDSVEEDSFVHRARSCLGAAHQDTGANL